MAQKKTKSQSAPQTNSEPRAQVFKEFTGCNFELSQPGYAVDNLNTREKDQSDLQMTYVVIQNNVETASNKTFEVMPPLKRLAHMEGHNFDGASLMHGKFVYLADSDYMLTVYDRETGTTLTGKGNAIQVNDGKTDFHISDFASVFGAIGVCSTEGDVYIGTEIVNGKLVVGQPQEIPNPESALRHPDQITAAVKSDGFLDVSGTKTDACPYKVSVTYCYTTKFGPTMVAPLLTLWLSKPPSLFDPMSYLVIKNIPTVKWATGIDLFFTSSESDELLFFGRVETPNPHNPSMFNDFHWFGYTDATATWPKGNLQEPTKNYSGGVKATHMTVIDSRVYMWGDPDCPYRLYIGGNAGNEWSTCPGVGGGFVDVEPETGKEIRVVTKYKTQSGNSIVTILCDAPNSSDEMRFNLVENQITLSNEASMKSWQAEQVAGSVGVKSPTGAVVCEDGLYTISRYGLALTTLTMEYNSQIRTNYVSEQIKPVFTGEVGREFKQAKILHLDGKLYLNFYNDPLIWIYDIELKAWWSYLMPDKQNVVGLCHIDWEGAQEGVGLITRDSLYLLPSTEDEEPTSSNLKDNIVIRTAELSTQQPQQSWFYLSQLEFCFDYFVGTLMFDLTGYDQFGRRVNIKKQITHNDVEYDLHEYMRIDLKIQTYHLTFTGKARFRMSHWIAKLYTMSAKQGLVWGFDDRMSHKLPGDIHPTFKDYNDVKKAIFR